MKSLQKMHKLVLALWTAANLVHKKVWNNFLVPNQWPIYIFLNYDFTATTA